LKQRREHAESLRASTSSSARADEEERLEALADLPRWQDLPMIPLGLPSVRQAGDVTTKLTLAEFAPANLDELTQLLQRLQHHWHIAATRTIRGAASRPTLFAATARRDRRPDRPHPGRGDKLRTSAEQYAGQLGLRGSITELLKLGDLLEKGRPRR